jgi:hypothetical protein
MAKLGTSLMYGLEGPDTGGEMKKRLLLLLLVLATGLVAQDGTALYMTNGEANGLLWRTLNNTSKLSLLMGVNSGAMVLKIWALTDNPVCVDLSNKHDYPDITNGDLAKEVDQFYTNAANVPLPVSAAVLYTYKKLTGATKEQLDQFRASALKAYVK